MIKLKANSMVLALLAFCVMASPQVRAESEQLTQRTARQVQLAYEMQLNEKPNEAIDLLKGVSTTKKYDIAYIARMLGGLYWQIEQPKQAIKALTLAVEEKVLASEQHRDAQRMLADILLMEGEYQLAEYTYRELVPVYTRVSDLELVWLRIAQAQYQQQKWSLVETSINHQQRYLKEAKLQPKVTPLNMKLGAQIAQKNGTVH
ncbi:tetratricopeptide repeat protein [Vibrio algarum]|uniref:Tetratricopeptide repeat protein n=1 Tax=Vibrio algarum TaxID=3020714 RepID=A0ABT4YXK8_9VIBR|nr:tetratricopeptide repeat protein [Vibrio sp. KJ40-1]MDB1125713.1 tetratricopeptide repeat protein [Vibrio sp. KJ40-1]